MLVDDRTLMTPESAPTVPSDFGQAGAPTKVGGAEGAVSGISGGRARTALRWLLSLGIVAALVWLAVRTLDLRAFLRALQASDWRLVLLAGLVAVTACMVACSVRLWMLTRPLPCKSAISYREMFSIYVASCAAHYLLPAPAAEVLRTVHLNRRYGYSMGGLIAGQVVEKIAEAITLSVEVVIVATMAALPPILGWSLGIVAVFAVVGAVAVLLIGRRYRPERAADGNGVGGRVRGFFRTVHEAMYLLRGARVWVVSIACSFINDFANALTVGLVASAVGVSLGIPGCFLAVLVARLAGLIPSTPGQFGVVEAGLVLALGAIGVDRERALALALLYHVAHFAPVTAAGLWQMRRVMREPA